MSTTTPISTNAMGLAITGTGGTQINNSTATNVGSTEFLNLMLDELQHQDPLSPSSSDPTQYLTELAQMTSVEQETDTAQNTARSATSASVSSAISLIGDTITYTDSSTGKPLTGSVDSVQITAAGATLTVAGASGVSLSAITNVQPSTSSSANGSTAG
jgi:flagellar basal-body rod modification protein FlgD